MKVERGGHAEMEVEADRVDGKRNMEPDSHSR